MAGKWKREKLGSVLVDKNDDKKFYIKFNKNVSFNEGECINLESKKQQIASLDEAVSSGRMKNLEMAAEIKERLENIPDFVKFEMIKVSRND